MMRFPLLPTLGIVAGVVVAVAAVVVFIVPIEAPAPRAAAHAVPAAEQARTIDGLRPPKRSRPVVALLALNDETEVTDYPSGKKGDVLTVEFTVAGVPCVGLNGGPEFKHNEAFSFQLATDDQAETDRLWNAIVGNGGQEGQCGWCKDKSGVSWQITPRALLAALADPDGAAAKRAFDAMMSMKKLDVAAIEAARRG